YTFLPCVLVGLSRAPQFVTHPAIASAHDIWANQVDAVVIPATACGGSAVLSFSQSPAEIITVVENQTRIQVTDSHLQISSRRVESYVEALGVLVAHKAGLNLASLRATSNSLTPLASPIQKPSPQMVQNRRSPSDHIPSQLSSLPNPTPKS
ncbi:MAG: DUF3326 domain-containing protein, partial [Elainellaceae cyanobacterium]